MTQAIENRVVSMQFDNSQFEKNVQQSMKTIDNLNKSIDSLDTGKSFDSLTKASEKVDMSNITKQMDAVSVKFTFWQRMAVNAMDDIYIGAKRAIGKITGIWTKAINQIKTGGISRAMNIASAQFQLEGLKVSWDAIQEDINYGVKDTAYGLDAAAKAASQLVASGVEFGATFGETGNSPMAKALRGISGVAAMTNSSYEDISRVFTTVAGQGRVMGDQLNQLAARGLNVAATLGEQLGKSEAEIRSMVSKGQIDFAMFSEAMDNAFGAHAKDANKTFSGALSNMKAALSRIGAEFVLPGLDYARDVLNALTPLINTFKSALKPVIDDSVILMRILSRGATVILNNLNNYKALRNIVLSVRNVLGGLVMVLFTIKEAFSEVFPPMNDVTGVLKQITSYLVPSQESLMLLKVILKAILIPIRKVLDVVKFGMRILLQVGAFIAQIVSKLLEAGGLISRLVDPILTIFNSIDAGSLALSIVYKAISLIFSVLTKLVTIILTIFNVLSQSGVISKTVNFLTQLASVIAGLAGGALTTVIGLFEKLLKVTGGAPNISGVSKLTGALMILGETAKRVFGYLKDTVKNVVMIIGAILYGLYYIISKLAEKFVEFAHGNSVIVVFFKDLINSFREGGTAAEKMSSIIDKVKEYLKTFGEKLKETARGITASKMATYALIVMMLVLGSTVNKLLKALTNFVGGFGKIGKAFESFSRSFKDLTRVMDKRNMLLAFSLALITFTVSVGMLGFMLSDPELNAGVKEAAKLLMEVGAAIMAYSIIMSVISKIDPNAFKSMAASLMGLAIAMSAAVIIVSALQKVNIEDVKSFWFSVLALLVIIGMVAVAISRINHAGWFSGGDESKNTALQMLAMAVSIHIIVKSFKQLMEMGFNIEKFSAYAEGIIVAIAAASMIMIFLHRVNGNNVITKRPINIFNNSLIGIALIILGISQLIKNIETVTKWVDKDYIAVFTTLFSILAMIGIFIAVISTFVQKITINIGIMFLGIAAFAFSIMAAFKLFQEMDLKKIWGPLIVVGSILVVVSILLAVLGKFGQKFSLLEKHVSTLQEAGKTIQKIGTAFILIAISIAMMALVFSLIPDEKYWKVVGSIAGVIFLLGVAFAVIIGIVSKIKNDIKLAGTIVTMTIMLASMIAAVMILTIYPVESMLPAAAVVGALVFLLGKVFERIGNMHVDKNTTQVVKAMSTVLTALMIALGVLAIISAVIGFGPVLAAAGAIFAVIVSLAILFKVLQNQIKIDKKVVGTVLTMVAIIGVILTLLTFLTALAGIETVLASAGALAGVILILAVSFKLLNNLQIDTKIISAIGFAILAVGLAIGIVAALSGTIEKALAAAGAIIIVVTIMALILGFLENVKVNTRAISAMAVSILLIGVAIGIVAALSDTASKAIVGALAIVIVMAAMLGMLLLMKDAKLESVAVILAAAAAIMVLSIALALLAQLDSKSLVLASVAIALAAIAIGAMVMLMGELDSFKLLAAAVAIVAICAGLTLLALALGAIASVGQDGAMVIAIVAAIILVLVLVVGLLVMGLGALSTIFPLLVPVILAFSVVLAALAVVILVVAVATKIIVDALIKLFDTIVNISQRVEDLNHLSETFTVLMFGMMKLAAGVAVLSLAILLLGVVGLVAAIGLIALGVGLLAVGVGVLVAAVGIGLLAVATKIIVDALIKLFDTIVNISQRVEDLNHLSETFTVLMFGMMKLAAGVAVLSLAILLLGVVGLVAAIGLIALGVGLLAVGVGALVAAVGIGLLAVVIIAIIAGIAMIAGGMFNIGANIGQGLIDGLSSMIDSLVNLIENIGSTIVDGLCSLLGIHSPSTVLRSIGDFAMSGFCQGLVEKFPILDGIINGVAEKCYGLAEQVEASGDTWSALITSDLFNVQDILDNFQFDGSNIQAQLASIFGGGLFGANEEKAHSWDLVMVDDDEGGGWKQVERWRAEGYSSAQDWEDDHDEIRQFLKDHDMDFSLEDLTGGLGDLTSGLDDVTGGLGDYSSAAGGAASETDKLADSVASTLDIFTEFNDTLDLTSRDVLKTFMGQLEGVSNWADELSGLAGRGISQAVLDDLADMGPSGYEKVHALYTMSEAELQLFNKMYTEKLSLEKSTANQIRSSFARGASTIGDSAEQVGESVSTGIAEGIENGSEAVDDSMSSVADSVSDSGKELSDAGYEAGTNVTDSMAEAVDDGSGEVEEAFANMGLHSLEAFKNMIAVEEAIDAVEEFQTALKGTVTNSLSLFDEVSEKEEISTEQMLKNMREQVKSVGRWATNLDTLAKRGISEGLLAELQALGPAGADKVDAFVRMSSSELAKANEYYQNSLDLPQYVTDKLTKSYAQAGFETTLGFVDGIDPTAARDVMTALGTQSLDALKESLDIHSPSRKTAETGMYAVAGLCVGIEENIPMLQDAAQYAANAIAEGMVIDPIDIDAMVTGVFDHMSDSMVDQANTFANSAGILTFKEVLMAAIEDAFNDISIEPRISPVLDDMSGIGGIGSKFSSLFDISGTINRAYQASRSSDKSSIDYTSHLNDIKNNQSRMYTEMQTMRASITNLNSAMSNIKVQLDGQSVGRVITPYVNRNLGQQYVNDSRRSMTVM